MAESSLAELSSSGIYQIRNVHNGKFYIGSAVNLAQRWRQHRCELSKGRHNPHLQNAWRKHGESAFVFSVVEYVADKAKLIEREQHHIDTLLPAYNCAKVAGSNLGIKYGPEFSERVSTTHRRLWSTPGYREKMSKAHLGYVPTQEQRAKNSAANRGRKLNPEQAERVAANNRERNKSAQHRALMSAYWKGRPKTPGQLEKMAATKRGKPAHNKGKACSEAQKKKQSEIMTARFSDACQRERTSIATKEAMRRPEVREKIAMANRGRKASPETLAKRSASMKAAWARKRENK